MRGIKNEQGFTLAELMIAVFVLAVGICGTFLLYISCMNTSQYAWDSTVAVTHAQHILEEMQTRQSLLGILTTDWNEWAQKNKLNTLPGETFKINYTDPTSNPLDIQVYVQWQRKNAANSIVLATVLTR